MKLFNYASILLCGLLLVGCANKTSQQKAVKNPDTKTVMKELSNRFISAWNVADAQAITAEFTNDAVRVISNPMSPIKGKNAILKAFEATFAEGSELYNSHIEVDIIETRFVSNDIYLEAGRFRILDKNNNILESGKVGNVLRYEEGKIKILLESAHRTPKAPLVAESGIDLENSFISAEPHFDKIQASVANYISNYNSKDKEGIAMLFIEEAVQNVNSKEGIILGREQIKETENYSDGGTLNANISGYRYLGNDLAIAYGNWVAIDDNNNTIIGQWGNLFKIKGDDALLIMESAGLR